MAVRREPSASCSVVVMVGWLVRLERRGWNPARWGGLAAIQTELVRSLLELAVRIPSADFVGGDFLTFWDHPVVVAVVPAPADGNDFEAKGFGKVGAKAFWIGDGLHWFVWLERHEPTPPAAKCNK